MPITHAASTFEAFDLKIQELTDVVDARRQDLRDIESAIAASLFVTRLICGGAISGALLMLLFIALGELVVFSIMAAVTVPLVILFVIRLGNASALKAGKQRALRAMNAAIADLNAIKSKKATIVERVVSDSDQASPTNATVSDDGNAGQDVISTEKTCPMCAETVKAAAKVCKHCKHLF